MIILVDDERRQMESYLDELKLANYKIEFRKDVGAAINFLKENLADIELLILDIMMPPGTLFGSSETNGGLRTGLHLYELIRENSPKLPILILTNVSDPGVHKHFLNESFCWYLRKEDCLPFELTDEVKRIFDEMKSDESEGATPS